MNEELLSSLELRMENWSDTQVIGDVFLKLAPFLKLYNQYSTQYDDAITHLQKCRQENAQLKEFLNVRSRVGLKQTIASLI